METRRIVPFFCDECGAELSTGYACAWCRRILCHTHYLGSAVGYARRRDGLCARCAEATKKVEDEKVQST